MNEDENERAALQEIAGKRALLESDADVAGMALVAFMLGDARREAERQLARSRSSTAAKR